LIEQINEKKKEKEQEKQKKLAADIKDEERVFRELSELNHKYKVEIGEASSTQTGREAPGNDNQKQTYEARGKEEFNLNKPGRQRSKSIEKINRMN